MKCLNYEICENLLDESGLCDDCKECIHQEMLDEDTCEMFELMTAFDLMERIA